MFTLDGGWLPRDLNQCADYFSNLFESDEWGVSNTLFELLAGRWAPFDVDWFASEHNAKTERFYTSYWSPNCIGIDAFSEFWATYNGLFDPPINLISRILMHMAMCPAYGVLVLPLWRSASFWSLLSMEAGYFILRA